MGPLRPNHPLGSEPPRSPDCWRKYFACSEKQDLKGRRVRAGGCRAEGLGGLPVKGAARLRAAQPRGPQTTNGAQLHPAPRRTKGGEGRTARMAPQRRAGDGWELPGAERGALQRSFLRPQPGEDLRRSAAALYFRAAPLAAGGRTSIHQPVNARGSLRAPHAAALLRSSRREGGGTVLNEPPADEIPLSFSPGAVGAARIDAAGSRGSSLLAQPLLHAAPHSATHCMWMAPGEPCAAPWTWGLWGTSVGVRHPNWLRKDMAQIPEPPELVLSTPICTALWVRLLCPLQQGNNKPFQPALSGAPITQLPSRVTPQENPSTHTAGRPVCALRHSPHPGLPALPFSSCLFLLILGGFLELVLEGACQLVEQPHLLAVLQEPSRRRGLIWGGHNDSNSHRTLRTPPAPPLGTKPDVFLPCPSQPGALPVLRANTGGEEWGLCLRKEQTPKAQRDQSRRSDPPAAIHLHGTLLHSPAQRGSLGRSL